MKNPGNTMRYLLFITAVSALGGILFGYDTGVVSGTIEDVSEKFNLSISEQGWYVSCALLGSIIGVACAGVLSDFFGRKKTLFISAILFTALGVGCALANSFTWLIIYRIIGGMGIGIVSIISPLYISEMSIPKYRGRLVALYQLAITAGFLAAYLINYLLLQLSLSQTFHTPVLHRLINEDVWRAMLGMEALPALLFLGVLFYIPESPRWLTLRKKEVKAMIILERLFANRTEAGRELEKIKSVIIETHEPEWKHLMNPGIIRIVIIGVSIAILGQFMGVNAVMYYGPSIFQDAGISGGDSLFYQVFVGAVGVVTTILALSIIDKAGRKNLVYFGVTGIFITLILIAFYFSFGEKAGMAPVWLLVFFLMYIFSCSMSINTVIWVFLSELYPLKVRGVAMSIAGFSLWVGSFLIGQLTPWMLDTLRPSGTFIFFAVMCIPYVAIVWKLIPETAGKSLEEIEKNWV